MQIKLPPSVFAASWPSPNPETSSSKLPRAIVLALVVLVSACDWVDSTGVQPDDPPTIPLQDGEVVVLTEEKERTLDPSSLIATDKEQTLRWDDTPLQEGNLPVCAGVEGFDPAYAQDTIKDACTSAEDCEIYFKPREVTDDDGTHTVFMLEPPSLRAPVGVIYQLVASGQDGLEAQANFTFCLVSENEEPVAIDDVYSVLEGTTLTVTLADSHLLQNDTDDIDLSNQPLQVVLPVLTPPSLATEFQLFADGTFSYTPDPGIVLVPGSRQTDEFKYEVTDGPNTVQASVQVNIVPEDAPPVLTGPIPDTETVVGIEQSIDLAEYFTDPEGGELSYSINVLALPLSEAFVLSDTGVLTGSATAQDVGEWPITVAATDVAGNSVESVFNLVVVANLPPVSTVIPRQTVQFGAPFKFGTSAFFLDPEGVALVYTLAGVANENIKIDRFSGIIDGFFSRLGNYALLVGANDGVNPAVTKSFVVAVVAPPNSAPVYTGTIPNQAATVGVAITPIKGVFNDPDADPLTFEVVGNLPAGLTISTVTGVISGRPLVAGSFTGLRIFATDSSGATVGSDTFTITVRVPVPVVTPNQVPAYSGSISDQTINLGRAIKPTEGVFADPDGDALTYRVVGVLPLGLVLSRDGVITGRPRRVGTSANLRIRATDPGGLFVESDSFRYTVRAPVTGVNRPPEYFGSIPDQTLVAGVVITPISGRFSDPDRDELEYSLNGRLPRGIRLDDETGILSGRPTQTGVFPGIRIVATDDDDLLVRSDRFSITVTAR